MGLFWGYFEVILVYFFGYLGVFVVVILGVFLVTLGFFGVNLGFIWSYLGVLGSFWRYFGGSMIFGIILGLFETFVWAYFDIF